MPVLADGAADAGPAPLNERLENLRKIAQDRLTQHQWEPYVHGFRREHNLAFTGGIVDGAWHLTRLGSLRGVRAESSGVFVSIRYSYHFQLFRRFGALLGTSLSFVAEGGGEASGTAPAGFAGSNGVSLPGVLGGLVVDLTPAVRLGSGAHYTIDRREGIEELDGDPPDVRVEMSMEGMELFVFTDVFWDLRWGGRVEYRRRATEALPPAAAAGSAADQVFWKEEDYVGLGIVRHFL